MRILLAEDDINLNKSITKKLIAKGYIVDSCLDGEEALFLAKENIHDVILLDRMLPSMEGAQILKELRNSGISIPVIMTTALGSLNDKVTGLNLGADDYLVKPFAFEELLARIQCVTRRSPIIKQMEVASLAYGDVSLDLEQHILKGPNGECTLSKKECLLFEVFLRNPGEVQSRAAILLKVWGPESEVEDGNLDNFIFFVRRRLKKTGSELVLQTIRGVGYMLAKN